jgi:uncharacterized damage-inducible protein DinB
MDLNQWLLPEFDHEMGTTRKMLERVPEDKPDFKPHPKSMSLARLAGHVAELPVWAERTLNNEGLDLAPVDAPPQPPFVMTSRQDMLERFDKRVGEARAAIARTSDEAFAKSWTLSRGGQTLFTLPRSVVLRNMFFNHIVHHRAQLGVYLRLNDVPLPPSYGPSADEGPF